MLPLFLAQSSELDNLFLRTHSRALQRLVGARWMSFSAYIVQFFRTAGFSSDAACLEVFADAPHVRASSASSAFASALADIDAANDALGGFLDHPMRCWVDASVHPANNRARSCPSVGHCKLSGGVVGSFSAGRARSPHARCDGVCGCGAADHSTPSESVG